ncbi:low molecular weight phosphatase family protein [Streptomyces fungicidicus]|uniref:hypothetical protein n=1 Tax=Streptomyces fungicidicus TaxID=68203 RepID=UPI0033D1C68D
MRDHRRRTARHPARRPLPGRDSHWPARRLLREVGADAADAFPEPLTDEVVQAADIVITMSCGDACPMVPGRRYLD